MSTLDEILDGLMRRYKERVPDVQGVLDAMRKEGIIQSDDDIQNDHIAFRSIGVPNLGLASLERIFLHHGYTRRDKYFFESKRLDAYWYAPPSPQYPRIFISELRVGDLSEEAQQIIRHYTDQVQEDPVDALDLDDGEAVDAFLHTSGWDVPFIEDYERLLEESEYAAWTIYNRYYLNHFTVSVHTLPAPYNQLSAFNTFLEEHGFTLNDSGGKIKESPDGLLLQSSTVAEIVDALFHSRQNPDGTAIKKRISGSYVEFAERRVLPEYQDLPADQVTRAHRRDGFEAGNADKIFESTYQSQTQQRQ
ncbi:MAG: DUF1338 domain-containing protein [Deltaproteobacteria bacterium]|nr:DUF1338 domain-containing protein [Deltaproteobacteria bacterium]|tara:strand:+ start:9697 stop:10614 length:918 start_codon:yes stop_codon:yes gene_type:complete